MEFPLTVAYRSSEGSDEVKLPQIYMVSVPFPETSTLGAVAGDEKRRLIVEQSPLVISLRVSVCTKTNTVYWKFYDIYVFHIKHTFMKAFVYL